VFSPASIFVDFSVGGVRGSMDKQEISGPHFSLLTAKSAKFETGENSLRDQTNLQFLLPSLAERFSKR
jgi:hypothetical protein